MSELFIPKKIRVGYQNREGTYTGKLAYVIYYDAKGKLRKEKSWSGWRDDKIEPEEFENTPQDGFHLNKDIQRYNWSHFGSNRSYIRIYDSRGIEFEVTPENLIGILTETNCSKRGLDGEFVYAWCGTELVLLPCSSEAYTQAIKYTERQGKKISARDLKPGCSYTTKKDEQVIYMGRFPWFTWSLWKEKSRISQKKHIFARLQSNHKWVNDEYVEVKKNSYEFFPKGDASFLAELDSEDPVQNYAELVDQFNADVHSADIEDFKTRKLKIDRNAVFKRSEDRWGDKRLARRTYTEVVEPSSVIFWELVIVYSDDWNDRSKVRGYRFEKQGTLDTKKLIYSRSHRSYGYTYSYRHDRQAVLTEQQVLDELAKFVEVDAVLGSGKKLRLKNIETIAKD